MKCTMVHLRCQPCLRQCQLMLHQQEEALAILDVEDMGACREEEEEEEKEEQWHLEEDTIVVPSLYLIRTTSWAILLLLRHLIKDSNNTYNHLLFLFTKEQMNIIWMGLYLLCLILHIIMLQHNKHVLGKRIITGIPNEMKMVRVFVSFFLAACFLPPVPFLCDVSRKNDNMHLVLSSNSFTTCEMNGIYDDVSSSLLGTHTHMMKTCTLGGGMTWDSSVEPFFSRSHYTANWAKSGAWATLQNFVCEKCSGIDCLVLGIHSESWQPKKYDARQSDVREMFSRYGEIKDIFDLIEQRGMVFVTFVRVYQENEKQSAHVSCSLVRYTCRWACKATNTRSTIVWQKDWCSLFITKRGGSA